MQPLPLLSGSLVGLFLWVGSVLGASQAGAPLTLGEAVFLALKENLGLKAAGLNVPAAQAYPGYRRARLGRGVAASQAGLAVPAARYSENVAWRKSFPSA